MSMEQAATCGFYVLFTILSLSLPEEHPAKLVLDDFYLKTAEEEIARLPKNISRLTIKELLAIQESLTLLGRLAMFTSFKILGSRKTAERLAYASIQVASLLSGFDGIKRTTK